MTAEQLTQREELERARKEREQMVVVLGGEMKDNAALQEKLVAAHATVEQMTRALESVMANAHGHADKIVCLTRLSACFQVSQAALQRTASQTP